VGCIAISTVNVVNIKANGVMLNRDSNISFLGKFNFGVGLSVGTISPPGSSSSNQIAYLIAPVARDGRMENGPL
jgi:hypothetical protein